MYFLNPTKPHALHSAIGTSSKRNNKGKEKRKRRTTTNSQRIFETLKVHLDTAYFAQN